MFSCLDISIASGPDGNSNKIIKICADGLSAAFAKLVNLSFSVEVFPEDWKVANVIPIFKRDDHQCKSNYCPVSLLDSFSKLLKKLFFSDYIIFC